MIETLSVSISGTALSFLVYENMKSRYTQEGFLIGEIIEKEKKTITDNDQQQVRRERTVHVSCAVPCPQPHYFYDGIGRIDTQKIKTFLGDASGKVVAWYKYRRGISNICLTFRERIIHSQLVNFLKVPPEHFTCCLLMSDSSDNKSTHSFNQTFVRLNNNNLEEIPLHIINLSDSNNCYKSPGQVSDTFLKIVSQLDINREKSHGISVITQIQNALQKYTDSLIEELAEAEKRLFELENEVKELNNDENGTSNNNNISYNNNNNEIIIESKKVKNSQGHSAVETDNNASSRIKQKLSPTKKRRNVSPMKKGSNSEFEINTRSKKKN